MDFRAKEHKKLKVNIEKEHRKLQNCSCSDNKEGVAPTLVFDDIKVELKVKVFDAVTLELAQRKTER